MKQITKATMAVMGLAMLAVSGCVSMRSPEIEQRIAAMPEGKDKTAAIIQYEQLLAQRASAYSARIQAIQAAANEPVYQPPVVIQQAQPIWHY